MAYYEDTINENLTLYAKYNEVLYYENLTPSKYFKTILFFLWARLP